MPMLSIMIGVDSIMRQFNRNEEADACRHVEKVKMIVFADTFPCYVCLQKNDGEESRLFESKPTLGSHSAGFTRFSVDRTIYETSSDRESRFVGFVRWIFRGRSSSINVREMGGGKTAEWTSGGKMFGASRYAPSGAPSSRVIKATVTHTRKTAMPRTK